VTPVELGKREKVQKSYQGAKPCSDAGRVKPQGDVGAEAGTQQDFKEAVDERLTKLEIGALDYRFPDIRRQDPIREKRDEGDETSDRACCADIEKLPLVLNRILDSDDRTESADAEDRDWKWNEIRGRSSQSMSSSGDEVAEFMAPENCQQRNGELETGKIDSRICQKLKESESSHFSREAAPHESADHRRAGEGGYEKGDVEPPPWAIRVGR